MKVGLPWLALLVLAVWTRCTGVDWDRGQLLHPDERFLVMLAVDTELPESLAAHLDPQRSSLNPYNRGRSFFVYGTLPLALLEILAAALGRAELADLVRLGRGLAAASEVATVLLVALLALAFERAGALGRGAGALAGFAYALAVLPIQQARFFTVDAFATCLTTAAALFALRFHLAQRPAAFVASAIALGLALGTKLAALAIAPLLLALVALDGRATPAAALRRLGRRGLPLCLAFLVLAYLALRVADPRFFATGDLLDPRPHPTFLANLAALRAWSQPEGFYPPAIQWIDRPPVLFALGNLACFGLGLPLFALACAGGLRMARSGPRSARLVVLWVLAFFAFQSTRFVTTLRYFYVLYPFLAVFAGGAAAALLARARDVRRRRALLAAGGIALAFWPASFLSIYTRPHPRVAASEWIRANVEAGSTLAGEHWDDLLPLPLDGRAPPYRLLALPVFDSDTAAKWHAMERGLTEADYLILSSNRGHGAIGRLPAKYPRMAAFYRDLFAGRLGFEPVREFRSFPTFLGVSIDDQCAEEAFTVYDHPKVVVFRRARPR